MKTYWFFPVIGVMILLWAVLMTITPAKGSLDLFNKIKKHPDAVDMGGWYRIIKKENLSNTEFDWRFDLRKIDSDGLNCSIGHRMEQNSGAHPDSHWVIEYSFIDYECDGILDWWLIDRFISVKDGDDWFKITPHWPDKFKYPQDDPNYDEANIIFQKELQYWNSVLEEE